MGHSLRTGPYEPVRTRSMCTSSLPSFPQPTRPQAQHWDLHDTGASQEAEERANGRWTRGGALPGGGMQGGPEQVQRVPQEAQGV
jgi:hypothetical protein